MKAKQTLVIACAALTIFATSAYGDTQYFVEGVVGQSDQENILYGYDSISDRSKSHGVRAGFHFGNTLGLELGHNKFGEAKDSYIDSFGDTITDRIETDAYTIGLRGAIKLGRVMSLVGRIGWAAWDLQYRASDSAFPRDDYRDEDSGIDSYYGFGLQFQPEENFRIAVEYSTLDFRARLGDASTVQEIDNYAVSVGYLF